MRAIVMAMAGLVLCAGPASAVCGTFFGTETDREQSGCLVLAPPEDARQLPVGPDDPAPGIFAAHRASPTRYELVVTTHKFTAEADVEKYIAYRAAHLAVDQHDDWFSFVQQRAKGDTVKPPKADPSEHFDFRLANFQPVWRYQTAAAADWKSWSPYSGKPFLDGTDPAQVTAFEANATIVLHKGAMPDTNPLAFNAVALRDLLVNQVQPPKDAPAPGAKPQASSLATP